MSLVLLAACSGADDFNPAPMVEVQRRAYVHEAPASISLYTIISNENGEGAHTALLINGSQRVLWDPAGSFRHPFVPERGDLHYGITEDIRKAYIDYHVRDTHHMIVQETTISPAVANALIAEAAANGSANRATCANSTSRILREAGLDVSRTWFPKSLMRDFGALPGVSTRKIDESNVDTSHNVNFGDSPTPIPVY
ncbi:hypothetical protein [Palleronia pontilimi]|nr:hypothetical protein [Palleronia pontilimi]